MGGLRPAVAVGFLAVSFMIIWSGGVFFVFVVENEFASGVDVVPSVGGEDGLVHFAVEFSEFENGWVGFLGVVETVVGGGESLVVIDEQLSAVGVVSFASGFESGVGFPVVREREGFKAIGGRIAEIIFHGRAEESCPDFVDAGLECAEC